MCKAGKTVQVAAEMQQYNLAVLEQCETKWTKSELLRRSTGETVIYSGNEGGALYTQSVGLLLSRQATASMMEWTPVSLRIITARLYTQVRKTIIFQCYAPTNESDEQMKEDF
jgi:hypothetical protein